jgi:hypothetical protein
MKEVAANAGIKPRGPYDAEAEYAVNVLVQFSGSEYLATAEMKDVEPPAAPWQLFVEKGNPGPANTLEIRTVTTLEPREQATADIEGDAPNQVLNLGIPAGAISRVTVVPEFGVPGDVVFLG